jgi:hypothetical protein
MDARIILTTVATASLSVGLGVFGYAPKASADSVKIMAISTCSKREPGHVAIAIYDDKGTLLSTAGMWEDKNGVDISRPYDMDLARTGKVKGCGLLVTRSANVTKSRREWIQNQVATAGGTNCRSYVFAGGSLWGLREGQCSCVNFGTRVWAQVTNQKEGWRGALTPTYVYNQIFRANGKKKSGWFENGTQWSYPPLPR